MRIRGLIAATLLAITGLVILGGCPTPASDDALNFPGDLANGRAVYDTHCASCHSLGTVDPLGVAQNLSGWAAHIDTPKHLWTPTLSAQDLADLQAWVAAN